MNTPNPIPSIDPVRINRVPREPEGNACSFAQNRLWFLHQLDPLSSAYNEPLVLDVDGELDVVLLERAVREVIERHETLRTVFRSRLGQPLQIVIAESKFCFGFENAPAGVHLESDLKRFLNAPFDLEKGPLLRGRIWPARAGSWVVAFSFHHIICDGWSFRIFLDELRAKYSEFTGGPAAALPELHIQYVDFSFWSNQIEKQPGYEEALSAWVARLQGAERLFLLGTPSPSRGNVAEAFQFEITTPEWSEIQRFGALEQTTPFAVMFAAYQILLWKYSGQREFAIGVPNASRQLSEIDDLIGLFAHTVPVRASIEPSYSFRYFLRQVHRRVFDAMENQEVPFEKVVERINPDRALDETPIFQVLFNKHVSLEREFDLGPAHAKLRRQKFERAKLDLSFAFEETADGCCECELQYNSSLLDVSLVRDMAARLLPLLKQMMRTPETQLSSVCLLSPAEIANSLDKGTPLEYPASSVADLFSKQAAATPEAFALVCRNERLSYKQLEIFSSRLAGWLQRKGLNAGETVALRMPRSAQSVIAMLGVTKAGGVYVPIDLEEPEQIQQLKLHAANPRLILSREDVISAGLVELEQPLGNTDPQSGAYVLFTSGSTGVPKAVLIENQSLVHYVFAVADRMRRALGRDLAGLNFASVSTLSADLGNTCIFPALLFGGTLHLVDYETATDPDLFAHYMTESAIDVLKIVPVHFAALWQGRAHSVPRRLLIFGGDTLPAQLVKDIKICAPDSALANHYGPTETCVGSLMSAPLSDDLKGAAPIGTGLGRTTLIVLDEFKNPVPPGVSGELYIGGPGVARGYINLPLETQSRFVTLQLPGVSGNFYRTGDLVRRTRAGDYVFIGRVDRQVKVRGYRVELAEVERHIKSIPGVQNAVVIALSGSQGLELQAFVVLHATAVGWVESELRRRVPAHMVPSSLLNVAEIPFTANGKLDQEKLLALIPPGAKTGAAQPWEPDSSMQGIVTRVWTQVLGRRPASAQDHFFRSGGHSLLAVQMASRLSQELQTRVPVKLVFQLPVFGMLASELEQLTNSASDDRKSIATADAGEKLKPSPAQQRLWFLAKMNPHSAFYNEPFALRLHGHLQQDALRLALRDVVRRHSILSWVFDDSSGELRARIEAREPECTFERVRSQDLQQQISAWAKQAFDLVRGPLYRFRALQLTDNESVFMGCFHHIVCDGVSVQVILQDLAAAYNAIATRAEVSFMHSADYSIYAASSVTPADDVAPWVEQLRGCEFLELPCDFARPHVQQHRGAVVRRHLSEARMHVIRTAAATAETTVAGFLLAVFQLLLFRYTNQQRFAIGVPMANRADDRYKRTVGLFVNTIALPAQIEKNSSFTQLAHAVRSHLIEAISNQSLPFDKVVEALNPPRNLSHSPIFQVLFNYNPQAPGPAFADLSAEPVTFELGVSKFDLSLGASEDAEGGLDLEIEYDSALFDGATSLRIMDHYTTLLTSACEGLHENVLDLKFMSEAETELTTQIWNATDHVYSEPTCVHQQIDSICKEHPSTPAVEFEGQITTYGELKTITDSLALHLRQAGASKGELIGVFMERSTEMVASLIAILKSGAAYVPIDPGYPPDRIAYMLGDSAPRVILTQSQFIHSPALVNSKADIIAVDGLMPSLQLGAMLDQADLAFSDIAYMIYTSGSTGKPKGALNTHAGIRNRLAWMQHEYKLNAADVVLQKTPFSFDVSVWEFFWPLMYGAKLVVARPEGHKDPSYLSRIINSAGVTTIHFVPSMLHAFLAHEQAGSCQTLKRVICSGEVLSFDLQARFFSVFRASSVELHNLYGPTETAIDVTHWKCDPSYARAVVPIGRPIHNTQMYVLDSRLRPMPIGVAGELYIGGVNVGRGYLNKPETTSEKFIPDHFRPGQTLYRTGDRARFLPDGAIEYLGRLDNQVKLRGFRIELGEIEVALSKVPRIKRSVCMLREGGGRQKQLIAYIVAESGVEHPAVEISDALKRTLPDHMVPSQYVFVDEIPVSPNGKVDYRRLPESPRNVPVPRRAAASHLEEQIIEVWRRVLGPSATFGPEDGFFDVGGNSLLLLQVQSQLKKLFEQQIELTDLFRAPTVAALASHLSSVSGASRQVKRADVMDSRRAALADMSRRRNK